MITKRTPLASIALLLPLVFAHAAAAARDRAPGFELVQLSLPGVPAAVLPADIDGDGQQDLVVVVVYNEWASVARFEEAKFDGVDGLVEVMNIVSAVTDRRELRVYPGLAGGSGFGPLLAALDLDTSIHGLQATASLSGSGGQALIALTDEGLAAIRFDRSSSVLALDPLAEHATSLAGDGRFYADFEFLFDLDADGHRDALVPIESGWAVIPGTAVGFAAERATLVRAPSPPEVERGEEVEVAEVTEVTEVTEERPRPRRPRLPAVRDLNGDGLHELVLVEGDHDFDDAAPRAILYRNLGGLRFDDPVILLPPGELEPGNEGSEKEGRDRDGPDSERSDDDEEAGDWREDSERIVYVGDLDGDGHAVAVARRELDRWGEDPTFRQFFDAFKRPLFRYRFYELTRDLSLGPQRLEFEASGYNFEGSHGDEDEDGDELDFRLPGGFQDLDGDGRLDLVSITLDFSLLPLLTRVLVTRSMKVQMNFHATCQHADGRFETVRGMDLSGQFKINLRNSRVRHLSQFAGDFDGDGRADFVQLGRGRKVTIHHGQPGCRYPSEGDETIELERKPKHLGLVRILDLNGDERADLYVVHPLEKPRKDRSTPVRVDIYLSQLR